LLGVTGGVGAAALAACGGSDAGTPSSAPSAATPATIDVFITSVIGAPPSRQKLVDDMTARFPAIKQNITEIGGSADADKKLLAAGAAGTVPDVFYQHEKNIGTFAAVGLPRELDTLAARDKKLVDLNDFSPGANATYTWQGRLYGLTHQYEPNVLYYNKTRLERAGLADPLELDKKGQWSLSRFEDYLKALTRGGGDAAEYGMTEIGGGTDLGEQSFWLWGFNAEVFGKDGKASTFASAEALKAWDSLTSHRLNGWLPSPQTIASWNLPAFGTLRDGKVGFRNAGRSLSWQLADAGGAYGVVSTPLMPNGKQTCRAGGNSYAVARDTKSLDAAWQVCAYLGTKGADLFVAERALFPNRRSTMRSDVWLRQMLPWEDARTYDKVASNVRTLFNPPGALRIYAVTAEAYRRVVEREASVKVAYEEAQRQGDQIIKEYAR
jgi:ABC-type glycerol-3-phosphate transport system substrate-binding protein